MVTVDVLETVAPSGRYNVSTVVIVLPSVVTLLATCVPAPLSVIDSVMVLPENVVLRVMPGTTARLSKLNTA